MIIKKILLFFMIVICAGAVFPCNVFAEELGACIFINGEYYTDTKVENSNPACILVALSFFEKFGYAVSWDNHNQIAMIEDTVLSGDEKYSSNHKLWAIMTGKDKLVINEPVNRTDICEFSKIWEFPLFLFRVWIMFMCLLVLHRRLPRNVKLQPDLFNLILKTPVFTENLPIQFQ
jgi:hypothetical protein